LVAGNKGMLAMDESNPTCNQRFARLIIPQTEDARRAYHHRANCNRAARRGDYRATMEGA
jgi:fructose-bisphosphate aldolase class 1